MRISIITPNFVDQLPNNPGVYRFFDTHNSLLYVGKAINLRKRIKSYFQKSANTSPRIAVMTQKINHIELTITENEESALILENNLIKQLKPKYNIIFRDDKTYPLIRITNHQFPKIDYYRGKTNHSDYYFGPYPNALATKQTIDTIQKIFKLRTCTNTFFNSRKRPCILHQIDRCTAPCVNLSEQSQYNEQVQMAINFLNGKYKDVVGILTTKMNNYADNLAFEQAAITRDKIDLIKSIQTKQIITQHNNPLNSDIISFENLHNKLYIYLIIVRNGMYIGDNHYLIQQQEHTTNELLEVFLENHYINNKSSNSIIINCEFSSEFIHFFTKVIGIKILNKRTKEIQKLLDMAKTNLDKIIEIETTNNLNAIEQLEKILDFKPIKKIECIDISHNQGENTIGAITVFDNQKIDSSQYRKYNLNNTNGNDILAMTMVLKKRLTMSQSPTPDLILVDGGIQQYKSIKNLLNKLGLYGKIRVLAIFKGEKRNPKFDKLIVDDHTLIANDDAPSIFKLLQELRDEAHRFAITGHRKKQLKKMSRSILEEIPGVGKKTKQALLLKFGSVKNIAQASIEELKNVPGIGNSLASVIHSYFKHTE